MINHACETEKRRVGRRKEDCPAWWKTNVGPDSLGCGIDIAQPLPRFEVWALTPTPAGYSSSEMGTWRAQPLTYYTRGQVQGVMDGPRGWGWRSQVCASPGGRGSSGQLLAGSFPTPPEYETRRKQCRPLANVVSTISRHRFLLPGGAARGHYRRFTAS